MRGRIRIAPGGLVQEPQLRIAQQCEQPGMADEHEVASLPFWVHSVPPTDGQLVPQLPVVQMTSHSQEFAQSMLLQLFGPHVSMQRAVPQSTLRHAWVPMQLNVQPLLSLQSTLLQALLPVHMNVHW
jgi:hypothetical protein